MKYVTRINKNYMEKANTNIFKYHLVVGGIVVKNIKIISKDKKQVNISSEDVRNIIEGFESVQEVSDVSNSMESDVFGYDVILDSVHVEDMLKDQMDDMYYSLEDDEEAEEALFEQAQYISDALVDSLKEYLENRFGLEDYHIAYDVYKASIEEGIGFAITISFKALKHARLYELASSIDSKNNGLK